MAIFHREKDKLHNKELKSLVLQLEGIFFDKHLKLVAAESRRDGGQIASRAVEDGIDLLVLASILGHSNLKMVMRYAHPSETFKADAIKRMEINKKAKAV
ncbi:MAG: hypothetical protein H0X49_14760 [Acidobacteria bacterium]|nr:hypothetical protein [Acidobacteriota bacterium]